nr:hypothetical protein [uncultured Desulfovibrio sp.]
MKSFTINPECVIHFLLLNVLFDNLIGHIATAATKIAASHIWPPKYWRCNNGDEMLGSYMPFEYLFLMFPTNVAYQRADPLGNVT